MQILFVCTGNLCRSPMAEVLLSRELVERGVTDAEVASAGTWAQDGSPAASPAVEVMANRGLDLSTHRARSVTAEELEVSDLTIGMTEVHRREILDSNPGVEDRLLLLNEVLEMDPPASAAGPLDALLASERPPWRREMEVQDPYGMPLHVYERAADSIETAVRRLADLLWPIS